MKHKKELMLSMVQELLKTKWFIFLVVLEAWRTKASFLQLHLHIFVSEDPTPSFLLPALFLFSFAFSLYFSDSIWIADFLLDLATFLLVPVELNYKRKKRKSVVFIYIKEQPKPQAPQGWGRRWKYAIIMWQKTGRSWNNSSLDFTNVTFWRSFFIWPATRHITRVTTWGASITTAF